MSSSGVMECWSDAVIKRFPANTRLLPDSITPLR
jgi:hypothetical protein